jgi:hypothetical protein
MIGGKYFERKNIMKRVRKVCCFVLFVCLFWVGVSAAGSWDLYDDMVMGGYGNPTGNPSPNGAWSYGLGAKLADEDVASTPDTSALVLFNKISDFSNCSLEDVNMSVKKWGLWAVVNDAAHVVKHTTEDDGHSAGCDNWYNWRGVPRGSCGMQPGWTGENYPIVARWTSPIAGVVQVHGSFGQCIWSQQAGRWIKHNSTVKLSVPSSGSVLPFDFFVTVAVGDKIDFIVTQGSGVYNDQIGLAARIDTMPNWDVYRDMAIGSYSIPTANPSGQWSYGQGALLADEDVASIPNTSALVLFDKVSDLSDSAPEDVNISVKKWSNAARGGISSGCLVKHTPYELDGHTYWADPIDWQGVHRGQVGLMPGYPGGNYPVVARWTSPVAGNVYVTGSFGQCIWGQESGRWIKHNSTVLFSEPNSNSEVPFSLKVPVAVGDKIDFIVTQGGGLYNDATGLTAQIDMRSCNDLNTFLPSDLNHDCYINFADFAIFAQNWLTCNDPQDPACSYTP